jgi:hypothetical protein
LRSRRTGIGALPSGPPTLARPVMVMVMALNIRQLTDVSACNLQQYLSCNRTVKRQQLDRISPGPAAQRDL